MSFAHILRRLVASLWNTAPLLAALLPAAAGAGTLDLAGGVETNATSVLLRTDTVLTNGTFVATNAAMYAMFPTGTVTVASGARLVFPDQTNRNILRTDRPAPVRLLLDGGAFEVFSHRDEDNYSHYWGYGGERNSEATLEVRNEGWFHFGLPNGPLERRHFLALGKGGQYVPVATFLGLDCPTRGFSIDGRLFVGCGGYGFIACTNCAFRAENIVFGSTYQTVSGVCSLSFAEGSTVTTKGFVCGPGRLYADVTFDRATVVVRPADPSDAVNARTNFFGRTGADQSYRLAPGGLVLDNDGCDITLASPLEGPGPLRLTGAGTVSFTCDQPFEGETSVAAETPLRARNIRFSGRVRFATTDLLERPPIPPLRNHVRLFTAAGFDGVSGRRDASGNHHFTLPCPNGEELHWGRRPGTVIRLR